MLNYELFKGVTWNNLIQGDLEIVPFGSERIFPLTLFTLDVIQNQLSDVKPAQIHANSHSIY